MKLTIIREKFTTDHTDLTDFYSEKHRYFVRLCCPCGQWFSFLLSAFLLLLTSCSSAPKRPAETFELRNSAAKQLEAANKASDQGQHENALFLLSEARRQAVAADDPALLVKTAVARGNIELAMKQYPEAFAAWEGALKEAETAADRELAPMCRISIARGRLALLDAGVDIPGYPALSIEEIRAGLNEDISAIKKDETALAQGWVVLGLAEKAASNFPAAIRAFTQALTLHEKGNFVAEAAYDKYLIASVHSVAGAEEEAIKSLLEAITLDRRAENSYGLASDWLALGEVYQKAGKSAEAADAKDRAAGIFKAIGLANEK